MIREAIAFVERYIDNPSAVKEWALMAKGFLPLSPTIMRDFSQDVKLAYHITDVDGLKGLKRLQGKKKEISVFKRGGEGISMGARREGIFLVSLSGKSNFDADKDFNSQLSRNGYKWLDPVRTDKDYVVNNKFTVKMNKKMEKYFKVEDRFGIMSKAENLDGKGKAKFIKWYFDESKKLITKKLLDEIKTSIAKRDSTDWKNDEYFLGEIKVTEVHIIQNKWENFDSEELQGHIETIEKLGFKYAGTIKSSEVEHIDVN